MICYMVGPRYIRRLKRKQEKLSNVREDTPERHRAKVGTPTMGGGLILLSLLIPFLLWMDVTNPLVLTAIFVTIGFSFIGYIDDRNKVLKKNSMGISGRLRLIMEFCLSFCILYYLNQNDLISSPSEPSLLQKYLF